MSVNSYLNDTAGLVAFAVNALSAENGWDVRRATGAVSTNPVEFAPDLRLPAAIVFTGETEFGDQPRRNMEIRVMLCADASSASAETTLDAMTDRVAALLDGQISGDAVFRIRSWRNIAADTAFFARLTVFLVSDH